MMSAVFDVSSVNLSSGRRGFDLGSALKFELTKLNPRNSDLWSDLRDILRVTIGCQRFSMCPL